MRVPLGELAADLELNDAELSDLAGRVGLRAEHIHLPLDPIGMARANREIAQLRRERDATDRAWRKFGFTKAVASDWRDGGFADPSTAARWRDGGFEPSDARRWMSLGFTNPVLVASLQDKGVSVVAIESYVKRGGTGVAAARWLLSDGSNDNVWPRRYEWCAAGFTPQEACDWAEHAPEPRTAAALRRFGLAPSWAASMTLRKVSLTVALEMLENDVPPGDVVGFAVLGVDPEEAGAWSAHGFDADQRTQWCEVGASDPEVAANWRSMVGDCRTADVWLRAGWNSPANAGEWNGAGLTPRQAMNWIDVGVTRGRSARLLRGRIRRDVVQSLIKAGFTEGELCVWAKMHCTRAQLERLVQETDANPGVVGRWRASGVDVKDWPRWMPALPARPDVALRWISADLDLGQVQLAAHRHGVDLIHLGDAVARGQSVEESLAAMREEPSPEPSSLETTVAAPPVVSTDDPFEAWLDDGAHWIATSRALQIGGGKRVLRQLFERSREWASNDEVLFEDRVGDQPSLTWLEEVLAHAESVRSRLRLAPQWPMIFDSPSLTVDLAVCGRIAIAWVGRQGRGLVVSFDTTTYDVWFAADDLDARLAMGLAVSWFLDCCIALRADDRHPQLRPVGGVGGVSAAGNQRGQIVYVPTPQFVRHVKSVRTPLSTAPPRAHRVVGHVRRLSDGRTPSAEARSNAPAHVRLTMGPDDTFVSAHVRGRNEAAIQLIRRLSQYSSLGDALGTVSRW